MTAQTCQNKKNGEKDMVAKHSQNQNKEEI